MDDELTLEDWKARALAAEAKLLQAENLVQLLRGKIQQLEKPPEKDEVPVVSGSGSFHSIRFKRPS